MNWLIFQEQIYRNATELSKLSFLLERMVAANEFYLMTYDGSKWRFKFSFKLERQKVTRNFCPEKTRMKKDIMELLQMLF